jgi:hypothetical protein
MWQPSGIPTAFACRSRMYAFTIPADIARSVVSPLWNLGDICVTEATSEYIQAYGLDTGYYLMRHLAGDYGVVYEHPGDRRRTDEARRVGRTFASVFRLMDRSLNVVTVPLLGQTILGLSTED